MTNPKVRSAKPSPEKDENNPVERMSTVGEIEQCEQGSESPIGPTNSSQHQSDASDDTAEEDEAESSSSFSLQECINEFRARRIRRISTQSREPDTQIGDCGEVDKGGGGGKVECGGGDATGVGAVACVGGDNGHFDPADVDLINQNRCNKEQERKSKPCKNGFCYCFTSDSGEGGGGGGGCAAGQALGTRGTHVRPARRTRKSESSHVSYIVPYRQQHHATKSKERRRRSAPANLKAPENKQEKQKTEEATHSPNEVNQSRHLTAISRLETSSADAPLIHIIQELHNNCVISEVRVNKHKMRDHASAKSHISSSPRKSYAHEPTAPPMEKSSPSKSRQFSNSPRKKCSPSVPVLDRITEIESLPDAFAYSTPLNSSSKSNESSGRSKHKAGGRLLQKRLSSSHVELKVRNLNQPPPKPPRRSSNNFEDKSSVSSLASTSPSVREAERVIDEFLQKRGVKIAPSKRHQPAESKSKNKAIQVDTIPVRGTKRREAKIKTPMVKTTTNRTINEKEYLPSCPSLSDIERTLDTKNSDYYNKGHRGASEKSPKEVIIGWKEPKISDMLNYDSNANHREFKSQAAQAEPQTIGWQKPHKVDLDTVDGVVRHNLASNMETKNTPVKSRLLPSIREKQNLSQKFIWGEQFRNLSPWSNNKNGKRKSNLKTSSHSFLKNSKKKILRLVSPKKDNKEWRPFVRPQRKTPLRSVGIQTTPEEDLRPYEPSSTPQSPPGSYQSAVQTSQQSTTPTQSQNTNDTEAGHFDFTRTVRSPPKKANRSFQRRLNFPLDCGASGVCVSTEEGAGGDDGSTLKKSAHTKTYRSYHSDLDQDVTLSKMGYILSNIRAKLEASDDHAVRTFQEIKMREHECGDSVDTAAGAGAGTDCPDGPSMRQRTRVDVHPNFERRFDRALHEPIYSEIEEDSLHISAGPQYDNKMGIQQQPSPPLQYPVGHDLSPLYAKVNKTPKPQVSSTAPPTPLGKFLHDSLKDMSIQRFMTPLSPLPEPTEPSSSEVSYSQPQQATSRFAPSQSLNNVRVQEHNSPPKKNRPLSKSDLSLHRSEIFLENLCRSEIIIERGALERLEKIENHNSNRSCASLQENSAYTSFNPNDTISYELPDDAHSPNDDSLSNTADESLIAAPQTHNQSTPKKVATSASPTSAEAHPTSQRFTTKVELFVDSY